MTCLYCEEPLLPHELWFPIMSVEEGGAVQRYQHEECGLRLVAGSAAHQLKECSCFGGDREDPPGMSKRQAAKLAFDLFQVITRYHEAFESGGISIKPS